MLSRKIPKLRLELNSKGGSSHNTNNAKLYSIGKHMLQGIPVLSIFALVGIISYGITVSGIRLASDNKAYAVGSTTNATSASLIIDNNTTYDKINATYNDTNYVSHQVRVNASNIYDYKLTITGPTSLNGPSGSNASSSDVSSWGYAWGTANSNASTLSYKNFTGSAETLTGEAVDTTSNTVDFTRTLAFAAKFTDNAKDGHYTASVNLGLTVTPTAVVGIWTKANGTTRDSGITAMQNMTADVCGQAEVGDSMKLMDSRDGEVYTIQKLADGNCWMTSNLAFDITQATNAMSSTNSDVVSGWSWPTTPTRYTTGTGWSASDTAVAYITTPTVDSSNAGDNGGYQSSYGYYYSWCAATAGCRDASGNNPGANVDAANSICPKGWKLPAGTPGTGTNDFAEAIGLSVTDIAAGTNYWSSLSSPTFSNRLLTVNNSTWIAAGQVLSGDGLRYPGTNGFYWSRTADSATGAYYFGFDSGFAYPASNYHRRFGYSVRCVAYEPQLVTYSVTYEYGNGMVADNASSLPTAQTVTTTATAQTFTVPSTGMTLYGDSDKSCWGYLTSWMGSDGKEYAPGATITLTSESPNLTLTTYGFRNDGPCTKPTN